MDTKKLIHGDYLQHYTRLQMVVDTGHRRSMYTIMTRVRYAPIIFLIYEYNMYQYQVFQI